MSALAASLHNFAMLGGSTDSLPEIEQLYRRAINLEEKLAADSPSVPAYQRMLANSSGCLGMVLFDRFRRQEAEQLFRRAVSLHEKLAADFPSAIQYQSSLAGWRNSIGLALQRMGRPGEAELEYRSVVSTAEKLTTDVASARSISTNWRKATSGWPTSCRWLVARSRPSRRPVGQLRYCKNS